MLPDFTPFNVCQLVGTRMHQQRRYHVLVADQDEIGLSEAVARLHRSDYVVAGASSVEDVQWWLKEWPVDLVVASQGFGPAGGLQLILNARTLQPEAAGLIIGAREADMAEARRFGIHAVAAGMTPDVVAAQAEAVLASVTRRQRWPRKGVDPTVSLQVGRSSGRLMDVSYGGLKFEMPGEHCVLRSPVEIDVPRAGVRIQADVIWSARQPETHSCIFGAAVKSQPLPPLEWRAFVDRLG